jgi:hypothetical protein
MSAAEPGRFSPDHEIKSLLAECVKGVRGILGDNMVGLYLTGSLAYGGFVAGRSDIDLQAVVRRPLTDDEIRSVEQLHREIETHSSAWAQRIECSYVALEFMHESAPPKTPRPWWGFGTMYAMAPAGNEWLINHYLLSKYGIALDGGPEFKTLVPPIGVEDVQQASAKDLFEEWAPKINDSTWLADSHHQSYLVLNLCRILHTVIRGEPVSKPIAARWARETYPEWDALIEEAEQWTYGVEMKRSDNTIAFTRFAIARVTEAKLLP